MSDPIRLLDDPSFSSAPLQQGRNARSLLELGREMAPPSGAKADIWSGLESALGAAVVVGSVAAVTPNAASAGTPSAIAGGAAKVATSGVPAASQTASGAALGTKLGLAGLFVGAALIATTVFQQPPTTLSATPPAASGSLRSSTEGPSGESGDPHAVDLYTNRVLATGNAPVAPKEASTDDPSDDSKPAEGANHAASNYRAASSPAPSTDSEAPLDRVSQLRREAELVQAARSELAAGSASAALKTLAQLDQEVPRGAMGQERTVLGIEALKKSGQGAAAAARAAAFLEANPTSPYAERLRPYVN